MATRCCLLPTVGPAVVFRISPLLPLLINRRPSLGSSRPTLCRCPLPHLNAAAAFLLHRRRPSLLSPVAPHRLATACHSSLLPLLPPTPPPHGLPSQPSPPLTHLLLPLANPFLPQSQPKPSPTLPSSSSSASTFSSLCCSRLCRSPRRTPLPPSLPSRFYRSQALLYHSLDLLFFITA
ncbi:hypothetical protein B296_00051855 [Ensete ventricosum]|uniref:Uncharacterized protein n=1 Tax=Ensete ventricosum TaxID=4639 RepID=A0A426X947_ENSVE|nr:hypothetical protein B296_00051855 [Ensete ventricosum]